jgi:hypothetical protein
MESTTPNHPAVYPETCPVCTRLRATSLPEQSQTMPVDIVHTAMSVKEVTLKMSTPRHVLALQTIEL